MATPARTITFEAIGTGWEIILFTRPRIGLEELERRVRDRIELFDQTYSRFRNDSLVNRIAKLPAEYMFPDDAEPMFELYDKLYHATSGKVTPLVGGLLVSAGYDAAYSLKPLDKLVETPQWEEVMEYRHPTLAVKRPVLLDFGAAGKGYLIDIIAGLLQDASCDSYLIDAGGDMVYKGAEPLRVGLENPLDPSEALGVVELCSGSICGSAGNRRAWAGLHHIFDPDAAEPVRDVLATWAVAADGLTADGLATALFFTDGNELQKQFDFDYLVVYDDMTFAKSAGLKAELFTRGLPAQAAPALTMVPEGQAA